MYSLKIKDVLSSTVGIVGVANVLSTTDGRGRRMLIDDVAIVGMFLEVEYWMWTNVVSLKENDENIITFVIGLVSNWVVDDMRILTDDVVTVNSNSVIELSKLLLLLVGLLWSTVNISFEVRRGTATDEADIKESCWVVMIGVVLPVIEKEKAADELVVNDLLTLVIVTLVGGNNNWIVDDMRILIDDVVTVNSNSVIELTKLLLLLFGIVTVVDITISR